MCLPTNKEHIEKEILMVLRRLHSYVYHKFDPEHLLFTVVLNYEDDEHCIADRNTLVRHKYHKHIKVEFDHRKK